MSLVNEEVWRLSLTLTYRRPNHNTINETSVLLNITQTAQEKRRGLPPLKPPP